MPRPALRPDEIERFRDEIGAVAERLFAEHGYAGVTLRGIAGELGCSPMTPYRYFADKEAIFDAVRCAGFARFGAALEAAAHGHAGPLACLRALGAAYVEFALDEPHAYRIMFELAQTPEPSASRLEVEDLSWSVLHRAVCRAVDEGDLVGDPLSLAHVYWGGVHGLVSLHLAGKLVLGRALEGLVSAMLDTLICGSASGAMDAPGRPGTSQRPSTRGRTP